MLDYLRGAPSLADLTSDRPRQPEPSAPDATVRVTDSVLQTNEMLLCAAAAALVRYTGQDEVVLAWRATIDDVSVMRLDASDNPGWRVWVDRCTAAISAAPKLPFASLRSVAPGNADGLPAVHIAIGLADPTCIANSGFDMAFDVVNETSHDGELCVHYASALFDASTVERFTRHLLALAEAGAHEPAVPLSKLNLLDDGERALLVNEWNDTSVPFSDGRCVHHLIRDQAAASPDSQALVCGEVSMTYAALQLASNRLANHLISLGARPGARIGVYLERSADMVVAVLATMQTGAAYVPLDPGFPPDRLALMAEDSQLAIQITTQDLANALVLDASVRQVLLDRDAAAIGEASPVDPQVAMSCRDLMYVIYTSGSTGRPKGVMLEHRSVVNFLETMADAPGFTRNDRLLAVTTLSFDIAGLELYLPLIVGGTVVVAPRTMTTDAHALVDVMERERITVLQATPATWRLLIDGGWSGTPGLKVLCGGEALPESLAQQLTERSDEVWNMYGPTETTIWSTIQRVVPGAPVSIGRPIANTTLYVLDREMQPTPIGVAGELLIGGDGLARGYHGLEAMTADRFIPDPFVATESDGQPARLYRTGDLVRYRADGRIEFIGRVDHQVKVRGFRIELGEIETAVGRHPEVEEAIVMVRDDLAGEKRLVGYVTRTPGARTQLDEPVTSASLRRSVQDTLPHYMVPSIVVFLEAMPRTPNGKTNRNAMPEPDWSAVASDRQYVAPRDGVEQRVADIWKAELGLERVGAHDDFFELGVTSLVSARVFARIERECNVELPLSAVFANSTVAALAAIVRGETDTASKWKSLVPIRTNGSRRPVFGVHGGAGTILLFSELSRRLDEAGIPMYGLQAQGLYGVDPIHTSVRDMATAYVAEIREVQPSGPYSILGYCFGALVAFEIVHQLEVVGERVELFASINGPSTSYIAKYKPDERDAGGDDDAAGDDASLVAPVGVVLPRSMQERVRRTLRIGLRRSKRRFRLRKALLLKRPLPEKLRENNIFQKVSVRAQARYRQPTISSPTVVYRATKLYLEPDLGFGQFVRGDVECIEVFGNQPIARLTMREPTVASIADDLIRRLGPG